MLQRMLHSLLADLGDVMRSLKFSLIRQACKIMRSAQIGLLRICLIVNILISQILGGTESLYELIVTITSDLEKS